MRRTRIEVPAAGMIMRRVAQVAMSALICCTLAAPLGATENRGRPRAPKAEREGHLARQRHLAQQHHRLSEAQMQKRAEHQGKGKPFRALVSLRVALEHGTQGHSHEQAAIKADAEQNQHKLTPDKQARAESRLARIAKEKQKLEEAAGTLDTLLVIALLHKMNLEPLEGVGRSNERKFEVHDKGPEKGRAEEIRPLQLPVTTIMDLVISPPKKPKSEPVQLRLVGKDQPKRVEIAHQPLLQIKDRRSRQLQLETDNTAAAKILAFPGGELIERGTIPSKSREIMPFGDRIPRAMRVEWDPWKGQDHGRSSGAGGQARPKTTSSDRARSYLRKMLNAGSYELAKKLYREKARAYHPDHTIGLSDERRAVLDDRFKALSEAWSLISEKNFPAAKSNKSPPARPHEAKPAPVEALPTGTDG